MTCGILSRPFVIPKSASKRWQHWNRGPISRLSTATPPQRFPGAPWFFVRPFQQPFVEKKKGFLWKARCNLPQGSFAILLGAHEGQIHILDNGEYKTARKLLQTQITLPRDVHSPSMVIPSANHCRWYSGRPSPVRELAPTSKRGPNLQETLT